MKAITLQQLQEIKKLPKHERILACKKNFGLFIAYYFPHYVGYKFADYHYDMVDDWHDLVDGKITELAWIMYRESAKTSYAKMGFCYLICYDIDPYINADSYDGDNAERFLFDVAFELQSNKRIIADFGQLYNTKRDPTQITQKQVKNFMTNPKKNEDGHIVKLGTRVEAYSTGEPVRGRLSGAMRPGFLVLDDFETKKSIKSVATTLAIREHMQEFKLGLDSKRMRVLYLGNYISEYANVQMLIDRAKVDPMLRVRLIPVHDGRKPAWTDKYAMTDKEAAETGKVSLEAKKRQMWTPEDGDADWNAEMLCQPVDDSKAIFKKEYFQPITMQEIGQKGVAWTYVTIDTPSAKEGQVDFNDFVGFCINYVTPNADWHFKAWREHLGPSGIIDAIVKIIQDLQKANANLQRIAWEDTAFTRGLELALRKKLRELQIAVSIHWLKPAGRAKEDRIRTGLLNRYESGMIYHLYTDHNECADLENELLRFPNSQHDDCSDATAYQQDIAKTPGKEESKEETTQKTPKDPYQRVKRSAYEDEIEDIHNPYADIE